jgi:hypothetical protein
MSVRDTTDATTPAANPHLETSANLFKDSFPPPPQAGMPAKSAEAQPAAKVSDTGQAAAKDAALGLPKLDLVPDGPAAAPGAKADSSNGRQALIDGAQKTLGDANASAADKLSSVEKLAQGGVNHIQVADKDGKMRDYSVEVDKAGDRSMVHLYGKDDHGKEQIALRGINNGDGTFSQEKDGRGRSVGFEGSKWAATEQGKSTVGSFSDSQSSPPPGAGSIPSRPADGAPPENPSKPGVSPKPGDHSTPPGPAADAGDGQGPQAPGAPGSIDRSQFDAQLKDPKVMAAFAGRMASEVGSQGHAAQVAFAEEVMNRASARNQTLIQALSGKYYPTNNPGSSHNPEYSGAITQAWKDGTDTTHGATGNASGKVGFGVSGGHYDQSHQWVSPNQTANIGGERFGYEQRDLDHGWQQKYEQLKRPFAEAS